MLLLLLLYLVTLTRCKLAPVSNALRAISVPNPARPRSTTFETSVAAHLISRGGGFPLSDNFYVRTYVNYKGANKIEAMY